MHQLTAIDQTSLTHDAKGNITTNVNAQTYVWDFDNRMSSFNSGEYGYAYDALGRRVSKTVIIGGGGQGAKTPPAAKSLGSKKAGASPGGLGSKKAGSTSITTLYVPDGQQEVAEYKNTGTGTAFILQQKYVYADYIDEPVLMLSVSGETETKYYYHQNNLYSVAALTDSSGSVVERYSYLAYGRPTFHNPDGSLSASQTSSAVNNSYLFTGRRLYSELVLQYSRKRYYDFDLGYWISRDPISDDVNLYRYCGNGPLMYLDPAGTAWGLSSLDGAISRCMELSTAAARLKCLEALLDIYDETDMDLTYESTPLVAQNVSNAGTLILVWLLGGLLSFVGALCYAELATAYPREGGDYVYLTEALGRRLGFLFAWAQLWVVRPGSIGAMAYVFARYANQLYPLGEGHSALIVYRQPDLQRPYRVPLYPVLPLVFCLSCLFMVYASLSWAIEQRSYEAIWAIALMALGMVLAFWNRDDAMLTGSQENPSKLEI